MNKYMRELAIISEILVDVSKSHITKEKAIVEIRKEMVRICHIKDPLSPTADETTFEVFNNKKDTWETVEYKENIFDDYIIDGIVKYECDNDWRIRLSKPKTPTAELNKQVISATVVYRDCGDFPFETTLELAHKITTFFMNESDTK